MILTGLLVGDIVTILKHMPISNSVRDIISEHAVITTPAIIVLTAIKYAGYDVAPAFKLIVDRNKQEDPYDITSLFDIPQSPEDQDNIVPSNYGGANQAPHKQRSSLNTSQLTRVQLSQITPQRFNRDLLGRVYTSQMTSKDVRIIGRDNAKNNIVGIAVPIRQTLDTDLGDTIIQDTPLDDYAQMLSEANIEKLYLNLAIPQDPEDNADDEEEESSRYVLMDMASSEIYIEANHS